MSSASKQSPSPASPLLISPDAFVTGYSLVRRLQLQPGAGRFPEALDAVDRLALTMSELCRSAVDSLAIAAGLEAEGLNDRAAAQEYGHDDLFELADELHRRVPRDVGLAPPPDPAPTNTIRALLRGVLFIAPALCGVTFLITAVTGPARAALAALQVLAWGYGQGIAHLAYARIGSGDHEGARRLLRAGTRTALLATAWLIGATGLFFGPPARALVPAAATLCFCLAAIPELVLGAEFRLAVTLAPAALGALANWLNAPARTGMIGLALAAAAAVALAERTTAPTAQARPRMARSPSKSNPLAPRRATVLQKADLVEAVPHFASGIGAGALLTLVLAGPAAGRGPVALHAALVLTIAMGAGEWHARWYQRQVDRVLTDIGFPGEFPWRAARVMLIALVRQAATAAALASAGYVALDRADPGAAGYYLFAVALAPGLLAALFLRSVDARDAFWPTAASLAATLAALPARDIAVLAALALETTVLLAIRAAAATARPWVHL